MPLPRLWPLQKSPSGPFPSGQWSLTGNWASVGHCCPWFLHVGPHQNVIPLLTLFLLPHDDARTGARRFTSGARTAAFWSSGSEAASMCTSGMSSASSCVAVEVDGVGIVQFSSEFYMPDLSYCTLEKLSKHRCPGHGLVPARRVAWGGARTGRRFLGCPLDVICFLMNVNGLFGLTLLLQILLGVHLRHYMMG